MKAMRAVTQQRSMVVSRSTTLGSAVWGSHWLGDNFEDWTHMRTSIVGFLSMSMFGMPLVGPDICAIKPNATLSYEDRREMCIRWSQLGAFYPFSRNHNNLNSPPQDPTAFGAEAAGIIGDALRIRYALLPYLYHRFADASLIGSTVTRPLFFEFPRDRQALGVTEQFLWGESVLVTPVLRPGATTVNGYFPPAALWWDWYSGALLKGSRTGWATLDAPLSKINVHIRGGSIIVTQPAGDALTTAAARKKPYELLVALNQTSVGHARGQVSNHTPGACASRTWPRRHGPAAVHSLTACDHGCRFSLTTAFPLTLTCPQETRVSSPATKPRTAASRARWSTTAWRPSCLPCRLSASLVWTLRPRRSWWPLALAHRWRGRGASTRGTAPRTSCGPGGWG